MPRQHSVQGEQAAQHRAERQPQHSRPLENHGKAHQTQPSLADGGRHRRPGYRFRGKPAAEGGGGPRRRGPWPARASPRKPTRTYAKPLTEACSSSLAGQRSQFHRVGYPGCSADSLATTRASNAAARATGMDLLRKNRGRAGVQRGRVSMHERRIKPQGRGPAPRRRPRRHLCLRPNAPRRGSTPPRGPGSCRRRGSSCKARPDRSTRRRASPGKWHSR